MMVYQFALTRYLEDGRLDKNFDHDGRVTTESFFIGQEDIRAVTTDSRGRIIVAGWAESGAVDAAGIRFALARYNDDGSLDNSFGINGFLLTNFDQIDDDSASAIAIDPCGRIVVAGSDGVQFALARYAEDGTLDNTFGNKGKVLTDFTSTSPERINSLVIDHARRIVVAGYAVNARSDPFSRDGSVFALARYNEDGSLDKTFDNDGKVLTDFTSSIDEHANDIAIDGMGKIITGGYSVTNKQTSQFALARYNEDGSLDKSFDNDGKVITNIPHFMHQSITAIAVDNTDRIIVAGYAREMLDTGDIFALACYKRNGSLDMSFGNKGIVTTDFYSTSEETIEAMMLDRYGRIVVAGTAFSDSMQKNLFALARYNSDGSLDKSFDKDGKVLTDFTQSKGSMASAITIDHYGRIIVAGSTAM